MISSCKSRSSSVKYALYPATRTTRLRYVSGWVWARRSVSAETTLNCDVRDLQAAKAAQQENELVERFLSFEEGR